MSFNRDLLLAHRVDRVEHLVIPAKLLLGLRIDFLIAAHNPRFPSPTNSRGFFTKKRTNPVLQYSFNWKTLWPWLE
jgi:hypothetical protein